MHYAIVILASTDGRVAQRPRAAQLHRISLGPRAWDLPLGTVRWGTRRGCGDGGSVIVSDALSARELALAHVGLAYIFEPLVHDDVAAGRLIEVMPKAAIEEPGLFLYFPRRAAQAPKLHAFIETARSLVR